MIFIATLFAVFLFSIWAGLKIAADPGYALFAYQHWTVQMPLWVALVLMVLLFIFFYYLLLVLHGGATLRHRLRLWRRAYRKDRALKSTQKGLGALVKGDWSTARQALIQGIKYNTDPLINYLFAAKAAQALGQEGQRDDFLRLAFQLSPRYEYSISLTQAKLQLQSGQLEQALATVRDLYQRYPKQIYILKLLAEVYEKLGDWSALIGLLPALKKAHLSTVDEGAYSEIRLYGENLRHLAQQGDWPAFEGCWQKMPRSLHKVLQLRALWINALVSQGKVVEALEAIKDYVRLQWQPEFVRLYGLLKGDALEKQYEICQGWLRQYGTHPIITLSLARLAFKLNLWGQAKAYYEQVIATDPSTTVYLELANLLETMHQPEMALDLYHKAVTKNESTLV